MCAHALGLALTNSSLPSFNSNNAMEWEKSCYRTLFQTKDREEGLLAFKEKRKPSYTGE